MSTRRITVEEVLEAYRVTGLHPASLHYMNRWNACAIGALAVANGTERRSDAIIDWANHQLDSAYQGGFCAGFDNTGIHPLACERMRIGYADGLAVRQAVFQGDAA